MVYLFRKGISSKTTMKIFDTYPIGTPVLWLGRIEGIVVSVAGSYRKVKITDNSEDEEYKWCEKLYLDEIKL